MKVLIDSHNWNDFAAKIARGDQYDYNSAAVDRMTDILNNYLVRIKGVKWQFKAHNKTELVDFLTSQGRKEYDRAVEIFKIRKAKAEQRIAEGIGSGNEILVALLYYNMSAESNRDRVKIVTDRMRAKVQEGYAAICAMKYKPGLSAAIKCLLDSGVPRHEISVIWGGAKMQQAKKDKIDTKKAMESSEEFLQMLAAQGITMKSLGFSDEDITVFDEIKFAPELRLMGNQSKEQRQEEIDRFQKGISKYCFYTARAGGVGLSLHHSDALLPLAMVKLAHEELKKMATSDKYVKDILSDKNPKKKWSKSIDWQHRFTDEQIKYFVRAYGCRRRESGYAFEPDIPFCPTRPRYSIIAPTYSAIDMVQMLGRAPRITSLSDTEQVLLFFRGTVEEDVEAICNNKLRCLSKVTRNPTDDWQQIIYGNKEVNKQLIDSSIKDALNEKDVDEGQMESNDDENGDEE